MSHRRERLVGLAAVVLCVSVTASPAMAAPGIAPASDGAASNRRGCRHWRLNATPDNPNGLYTPTPADDDFYAQPDPMPCVAPGTILDSEPITFHPAPDVEAPEYEAWRIKFLSLDSYGGPVAGVTTVVKPRNPRGRTRLLAYQDAYNSVGITCAPSFYYSGSGTNGGQHAMHGYQIVEALDAGWTVTTADWGGPRAVFPNTIAGGRLVLDSIRAAENFAQLELTADTPVGLLGFSATTPQTYWAAMQFDDYAPELNLVGMVSGATFADNEASARGAEDDPILFPIVFAGSISVGRSYPDFFPEADLNARGRAAAEAVKDGCVGATTDGTPQPQGKFSDYTKSDDPFGLPGAQSVFDEVDPLLVDAVPGTPAYVYHGTEDTIFPVGPIDALVQKWCDANVGVTYNRIQGAEHFSSWSMWVDGLRFLESKANGSRFTSTPTTRTC